VIFDYDDPEVQELAAQVRAERRYAAQLAAHPDPRDPDYPGDWEGDDE
jgi:hypothetical protein